MAWSFNDINLSDWMITLPVDYDYFEDGGGDGDFLDDSAASIKGEEFEGAEVGNMFYYDNDEGAMVFRADVLGAETSGSDYARSELREMDGEEKAAWSIEDGGTLSATLKVTELAKNFDEAARVAIGQIHGEDSDFIILFYDENGNLSYSNRAASNGEKEYFYFENEAGEQPNVSLDETFSYKIEVQDEKLYVEVYTDGEVYSAVSYDGLDPTEIHDSWYNDTFYFKAGLYQVVSDKSGHENEGVGSAEAAFYDIDMSHTPGEGTGAWLGDGDIESEVEAFDDGSEDEIEAEPEVEPEPEIDEEVAESSDDEYLDLDQADNKIFGTHENDEIRGSSGNDSLYGYSGDDIIKGEDGDDILSAGEGNNELWGNEGDDLLIAGELGSDWLKGGNGADTFRFITLDGVDTVADFRSDDGDKIDLANIADDFAADDDPFENYYVQLEQVGDNVEIYIDNDGIGSDDYATLAIILEDREMSDVSDSDFIFAY